MLALVPLLEKYYEDPTIPIPNTASPSPK